MLYLLWYIAGVISGVILLAVIAQLISPGDFEGLEDEDEVIIFEPEDEE